MEFNYTIDESGKLIVADGVKEIPEGAFCDNKKINEVILPNSIKKIGEYAFGGYPKIKKVTLPNSLEEISYFLFQECRDLEKIIIPDGVTRINNSAFLGCIKLKELIISKRVTNIGKFVFYGCKGLKEIIIPKSVKKIGSFAFSYCICLEKIKLSASIEEIDKNVFEDCTNLKEIIITYDNINELDKLFDNFIKPFSEEISSYKRVNKLNIIFVGNKLPIKKQIKYKTQLYKSKKVNLSFEQVLTNSISYNNDISLSKEVEKLIDKINNISNNLSDNTKSIINDKVSNLLNNYKLDMKIYKDTSNPKLDIEKEDTISLELSKINPEITLISELTTIYSSLCNKENLLKDLSLLEEYRKIINSNINNLPIKEDSIEDILKSIMFIISKIDENKRKEIYNQINNYLSNIEKEYKNMLDNIFKSSILTIENNNLNFKLRKYLTDILDNIKSYYDKVIPYLNLLEALNTNNVEQYDYDNTLESTIISLKYLISCIKNDNNREYLEELYNKYISNYKKIINDKINVLDTIDKKDYKELVKNMLKDINPILENLNLLADIDAKEEIINSKIENIILQIDDSIKVLEGNTDISTNKKVIEYFILEFYKLLINSNTITIEDKEENLDKMKKYLITYKNNISNQDKDYNMIINDILSGIAKRYVNLEIYLIQNKEYKKVRR